MGKSGEKGGGRSKRKIRVEFRSNRSRPPRAKNWTRQLQEERDDETRQVDRVVAKGDLSRKRTIIASDNDGVADDSSVRRGKVVALRGQFAEVDDGQAVWPCTVRRVLRTRLIRERFPVAVGDRVAFRVVADTPGVQAEGVIEGLEPRTSELKRVQGHREQVIAANVDQVLIVSSADQPPPKPHLIDRYIVSALAGRMTPIVCVNKIDLDSDGAARSIAERYDVLGYRVLLTCAIDGHGTEALRDVLAEKSTVIAGQSGVGKSSLLNAIQPGLSLLVAEVSSETFKGRHTTSTARLIRLDFGAYVVDTPGIRSFDISAIPLAELEQHFIEFVARIAECKFPDCSHTHENNCAIKQAVEAGEIHIERYESYVRMLEERYAG